MCVNEQQLKEAVENGLSYVRISFRNEIDDVFLAFREKPTGEEISDFLKYTLRISEDDFTETWTLKVN